METFMLIILYLTYGFLFVAAIAVVVVLFMGLMLIRYFIKEFRKQEQLKKDILEGKLETFK